MSENGERQHLLSSQAIRYRTEEDHPATQELSHSALFSPISPLEEEEHPDETTPAPTIIPSDINIDFEAERPSPIPTPSPKSKPKKPAKGFTVSELRRKVNSILKSL